MCCLYGWFKKTYTDIEPSITPNPEILKLRGRDSFGNVIVFKDDALIKEVSNKIDLTNSKCKVAKYFAFESRAIPEPELIEHAKEGLNHDRDTQPFYNDDWITSHNGTIIQPEKIIKTWQLSPKSPVDSALLPELFNACNPVRALKYHIDGSFALAAYDRLKHEYIY